MPCLSSIVDHCVNVAEALQSMVGGVRSIAFMGRVRRDTRRADVPRDRGNRHSMRTLEVEGFSEGSPAPA